MQVQTSSELEQRIADVGQTLVQTLRDVLQTVPASTQGPQALARSLGVDKVLTSRVLKAARAADPISATHRMPGPAPLRRLVQAAARKGAPDAVVTEAIRAIDRFEVLIGEQIGGRSLLDTIVSAWVPEARREFELRRKQSLFKAMSQLRGAQAETLLATVLLQPSASPGRIDVVWVNGLVRVHRVRPGVNVKIATRKLNPDDPSRQPTTLDGRPLDDAEAVLIDSFCSTPRPRLNVVTAGAAVFYTLADGGFGADAAVDLAFAEVSRNELPRFVPPGANRKSFFFAEVSIPTRTLQFDVLVHEDLYPGQDPALRLYDTSFEGVASPNDPARDMDRLNMLEVIEPLGGGTLGLRSSDVPRYAELIDHVVKRAGFDAPRLRAYRCRIEYPVYGSQATAVFNAVERPT